MISRIFSYFFFSHILLRKFEKFLLIGKATDRKVAEGVNQLVLHVRLHGHRSNVGL